MSVDSTILFGDSVCPIRSRDPSRRRIPARIGMTVLQPVEPVVDNVCQRLIAVAVELGVEEAERPLGGAYASAIQVRDYVDEDEGVTALSRESIFGEESIIED